MSQMCSTMDRMYTLRVYCKKARSKIALLLTDMVFVETQRCVAHEIVDLGTDTATRVRAVVKQRTSEPLENMFIKKETLYGCSSGTFSLVNLIWGAEPPAACSQITLVSMI